MFAKISPFYFTINICSDIYINLLNKELYAKLNDLIYNFYDGNFFFDKKQINEKVKSSLKISKKIFIGEELSLSHKIKYFLKKHNLLDDNVEYLIDYLIKIRNKIAHGRNTYKDSVIYPLPPFFSLVSDDSYEMIDILKFLTGRMIASYIGINVWKEGWEEVRDFLLPPKSVLELFFEDKSDFNEVNVISLCNGNAKNITWRTIFYHYILSPKKFNIDIIGNSIKEYFINSNISEENGEDLFKISIILCDCKDNDVREKAIDNVHLIIKNQWYGLNFKDVYRYLKYYEVAPIWYKKYLDDRKYLLDKLD